GTGDGGKVREGVVEGAGTHLPDEVTLTLAVHDRLPPVAADEQQLRQVLVNLVENAVKYSPDGGPVTVTISRGERGVRWAVADRGLGIPSSHRPPALPQFYPPTPNMTRGIGGTGPRPHLCRQLVHPLDR